ncbi:cutinase family protein [Candidatus Saccharibacteria bacterium]|nr:cutinase family protein [Candidatus Saccharibacteria bacterium]
MQIALTALLVASAAAFTVANLPLAAPASAASCDDIKIIFARGSGQKLGESEYQTFKSELTTQLTGSPELTYSFYELGTASQDGHQYPAIELDFLTTISATISAGSAFKYGESVSEGMAELTAYTSNLSTTCPETKFVLAGYSQGAQVVSISAPKISPEKIIYAATFGDPKLYLPEGKGINPPACSGQNLSPYRAYAPNCKTYQGSLGAKNPYQESGWDGKLGLYCNDKDLICGAGLNLSDAGDSNFLENIKTNAMLAHTSYVSASIIKKAAEDTADKIALAFAGQTNSTTYQQNRSLDPDHQSITSPSKATSIIIFDEPSPMFSQSFIAYANDRINDFINRGDDLILSSYSSHGIDSNLYLGMLSLGNKNFDLCGQLGACAKYIYFAEKANINNPEDYLVAELEYLLNKYQWPDSQSAKNIYIFTEDTSHASPAARQLILEAKNTNTNIEFVSSSLKTVSKTNPSFVKNVSATSGSPKLSNISYNINPDGIELKYQSNAAALFISVNDAPLGLTTEKSLNIIDINIGDKLTLTPIDDYGNFGEASEIIIKQSDIKNIAVPTIGEVVPHTPNCGKR